MGGFLVKIVSYRRKDTVEDPFRIGFIHDEVVVDLQHAYMKQFPADEAIFPSDPNEFFLEGSNTMEKAKKVFQQWLQHGDETVSIPRKAATLGIPIASPSKIICVGKNYADHVAEMRGEIPNYPVLFAKYSNALIGPEDEIIKSASTRQLDYEVELTIIIGKVATKVKKENALDYIAGYTIGNDITGRDLQKRTPQWLQGKTLDHTTPIGPWIVTADEIGDPSNLSIKSYVNGEERQSSNTSHLIFDIPFLIEFISEVITLNPGDIIMTGTPDGVGFAMDPPQFLQDGDIVTLEIEKIGQMENKVVDVEQ